MTPDQLRHACRLIFGDAWQTAAARALHVTPRTVRHWSAGKYRIPDNVPAELAGVADDQIGALRRLIAELRRH